MSFSLSMNPASYMYVPFWAVNGDKPPRVRFENPFYQGDAAVRVHLLYKRSIDDEWSHQDLSGYPGKEFCLESPDEDYDDFVVILSNGNWNTPYPVDELVTLYDHCEYEVTFDPNVTMLEGGQSVRLDVKTKPTHPREGKPHEDGEPDLEYSFQSAFTRGGFLTPAMGPDPFVVYLADTHALDGVEAITVSVEQTAAGSRPRRPVGGAEATINVKRAPFEVALIPDGASIQSGQSVNLEVYINSEAPMTPFVYVWGNTASRGSLEPSPGIGSPNPWAVYTANAAGPSGSDQVSVQVYDDQGNLLGQGSAVVHVEGLSEVTYDGALSIIQRFWSDSAGNPRVCTLAKVTFDLKPGAVRYIVNADGSPQPPLNRTLTPPFQPYVECPTVAYMRNGVSGNTYHLFLSGGSAAASAAGDMLASFQAGYAGLVVKVTAQF